MDEILMFLKDYNVILIRLFIICFIFGYLFGSVPVGYLYSKKHGVDILKFGSGNPGSTNVGRALGKNHGRIVFILDILKIVLPVIIISILFYLFCYDILSIGSYEGLLKFFGNYIAIYTGLGGIIGHNFPLFLKFRGGKGISCTMGAIFCFSVIYSLILFCVYKIVTKVTKYVSLGSLSAVTVLLISSIILSIQNIYPFNYNDINININGIGVLLLPGIFVMWALAVIRHKDNIIRLLNGTESKTNN